MFKYSSRIFLETLVYNKGEFLYRERGINSPSNTLVLFKFDNEIIASAILKKVEKFDEPKFKYGFEYKGALYFDISTIEVFKPIDESQLASAIPGFTLATRGQNIDIQDLDTIINLINKNIKESCYRSLGLYDSYKKVVGEDHSFTEHELKKILFHLVKNRGKRYYAIENGAENNEYLLHSNKGNGYIQVDEFKDGTYKVIINLGSGDYNYFNTDRFNQLFKLKF